MSRAEKLKRLKELETQRDSLMGKQTDVQKLEQDRGEAQSTVKDMAISGAQSTLLEFGDEMVGAIAATAQKIGDDRPWEELYKESRDVVRGEVSKAREGSPIMSLATDVVAPNPLKFLNWFNKGKGMVRAGKELGEIAVQQFGATEQEEFGDMATEVGITSPIAFVAGKGIQKVAGKIIDKPQQIAARFMGLKGSDIKKMRHSGLGAVKEVEDSISRLSKQGLFSSDQTMFNPIKNTWRYKAGWKRGTGVIPTLTPEKTLRKMDQSIKSASKKINNKLDKLSPETVELPSHVKKPIWETVSTGKQVPSKTKSVSELTGVARPEIKGIYSEEFLSEFDDNRLISLINDTQHQFDDVGEEEIQDIVKRSINRLKKGSQGEGFTLKDLQSEKQTLYRELETDYGKANIKDSAKHVKMQLASMYKDMVNKMSGDAEIKNLNQTMEDMFNFKSALTAKVFGEVAESGAKGFTPFGTVGYKILKTLEGGLDKTRLPRLKAGEAHQALPRWLQQQMGSSARLAPTRMLTDLGMFQQEEQTVVPYRKPQSLVENIQQAKLSRNTEKLLTADSRLLTAKIAQQRPEMYDLLIEAQQQGGEAFDAFIQQVLVETPFLFEQDKYNRMDGKILDPMSKTRAIKDIDRDESMNPIEKAQIIDRLNKTGEFPL